MSRIYPFLLPLIIVLTPAFARAFSDPALFERPVEQGGGGGRYFTGSPVDGYTCAACHRNGTTPRLSIYGLPSEFVPGTAYDVTLRWADPAVSHSLQLELLTERAETPEVILASPKQQPPAARCESIPERDSAVYAFTPARRNVIGVRDCFASEVSFRFVAPQAKRVYLSASIVRSDSSGSVEGDGVLDVQRTLVQRGTADESSGGCAAHERGAPLPPMALLAVAWLATWFARRRRHDVGPLAVFFVLCSFGCYQPEESADFQALDAPPTGSMALDAGKALIDAGPDDSDSDAGKRRLLFRMNTGGAGGRYAPRNIGAIWIETADGQYVKTLKRWAGTRLIYLRKHLAKSGGDVTDAITAATLAVHELHEVSWNFTDVRGMRVPDGRYQLGVELTDKDFSGPSLYIPFTSSDAPLTVMPASTQTFRDMVLTLE